MANKSILPSLPGSDESSIQRNAYHGFYGVGARDFWGENAISSNKLEDKRKCDHYFVREGMEVRCQACFMGWVAPYDIQTKDGKLYINDKEIGF